MVFLDEHHVVQSDTMVDPATAGHRVLLGQAQAGQGLAGIEDIHPGTRHGFHVGCRRRGRSRQGLQKIQGGPFGRQYARRFAMNFTNHLIRGHGVAIRQPPVQAYGLVHLSEHLRRPGNASKHRLLPADDARPHRSRRHQPCRQVATAHILLQGEPNIRGNLRGGRQHQPTSRSSTSNTRVALGGITPPAPAAP